jgi:hypothetical protein
MESFFSSLKIAGLPPLRDLVKVWLSGQTYKGRSVCIGGAGEFT